MKRISLILAIIIFLASCGHKHGTSIPVIQILDPDNGQMYDNGDMVDMRVSITHDDDLHHVELTLIHLGPDTALWKYSIHSHARSLALEESWQAIVDDHTDVRFRVFVHDHNNNIGLDSVDIHIMP